TPAQVSGSSGVGRDRVAPLYSAAIRHPRCRRRDVHRRPWPRAHPAGRAGGLNADPPLREAASETLAPAVTVEPNRWRLNPEFLRTAGRTARPFVIRGARAAARPRSAGAPIRRLPPTPWREPMPRP